MASEPATSSSVELTLHKAGLATDGSGAIEWWDELTELQAVDHRKLGENVVVRGPDKRKNKQKAKQIEAQVGKWKVHPPHARPGNLALPHFQQDSGSPKGHTFYEVDTRKARKKT
jgi:hypothetical protein